MNIEVKEISSVKKELKITVPKDVIDQKFEEAYTSIGKKAKIKGFRPGKAPRDIIKRSFKDSVIQDLFKDIIQDTYFKALGEKEILPIAQPEIHPKELEEGKDFEYTAYVEIKPVLDNITYKGYELKKSPLVVNDKEIEDEIEKMRAQHATMEKVDDEKAVVEDGQVIKFNFEGFYPDGRPLENGKAENQLLELGQDRFIESLEKGMIGLPINEEKTVEAKFPEDYHSQELQNQVINFKVKVLEINKKVLPEVNDEFAKKCEVDSLNALKERTKKDLLKQKEHKVKFDFQQEIANVLLDKNEFEVPASIVAEQKKNLINEANMRLAYIGKENLEKYVKENDGEFETQAIKNVKLFFLFEEIGKRESIEITSDDIDNKIKEMAENSPQSFDEIKENYKKQHILENLRYHLKEEKIYSLIEENSTVTEKE